jgi:hypothetical protein
MLATNLHMLLLSVVLGGSCAFAAEPAVPETFLPATGYLRQVLDQPVTGTFNKASVEEVIEYLRIRHKIRVNMTIKPGTAPLPLFTGTFEDTPFRTALYKLTQEAGIKATLEDRGDGAVMVVIVPKVNK